MSPPQPRPRAGNKGGSGSASRGTSIRLAVELVPEPCWGTVLPREVWDRLRRRCYEAGGYACEVCGGHGSGHPMDCHELWSYDDARGVQRLVRVIALCPDCHGVQHLGLTRHRGGRERERAALAHLARVNGWRASEAALYAAAAVWHRRSRRPWSLDLTALRAYGIEPPSLGPDDAVGPMGFSFSASMIGRISGEGLAPETVMDLATWLSGAQQSMEVAVGFEAENALWD